MNFATGPHFTLRSLTLPGDISLDSHWLRNTKERQVSEHSVLPVADLLDRFSLQRDQWNCFAFTFDILTRCANLVSKVSVFDLEFNCRFAFRLAQPP
jgi:hypothetical protein